MSFRRGVPLARRQAFWPVVAIAFTAVVAFMVAGAGAASQVAPTKSLAKLAGTHSPDGLIDASRYLGRNSSVPVQIGPNTVRPMKALIRQKKAKSARAALRAARPPRPDSDVRCHAACRHDPDVVRARRQRRFLPEAVHAQGRRQ